jgi:hypothetical protein
MTSRKRLDRELRLARRASLLLICVLLLALLSSMLSGCSPKIIDRVVTQHDTTQVVKIDSVWQFQRDSIFVKEKGDTVYKYVEHIRYRDRYKVDTLVRVREVHDTTAVEVKVEKSLSWSQKAKIGAFPWVMLGLIACLVWIFRKWIFKL